MAISASCPNEEAGTVEANGRPSVTIITPAYNRADFLPETIESVLQQDYSDIEYLVINDGSTDNTNEVLGKYSGKIAILNQNNMGENATVNRGLRLAKGDIICVVNSDDPLLPGAVSQAVGYLCNRPDCLAAYPDWQEIDGNGDVIKTFELPEYTIESMLVDFNVAMGPGVFVQRQAFDLIGLRNETLKYTGDLDFWFRLALHSRLGRIPAVLATHRTHAGAASVTDKGTIMANEVLRLVDMAFASPRLPMAVRKKKHAIYARAHSEAIAYCEHEPMAVFRHRLASRLHALLDGQLRPAVR